MLVIVDLQQCYYDTLKDREVELYALLDHLSTRVKEARQKLEPIVNLTHFQDGLTMPEVIDMYVDYPRVWFMDKEEFDGSESVDWIINNKEVIHPDEPIELCGIFRNVCVLQTWTGLRSMGYNVLPVKKSLTMETDKAKRQGVKYPEGYLC